MKALVGALSVIVKTDCETDGAQHITTSLLNTGVSWKLHFEMEVVLTPPLSLDSRNVLNQSQDMI